MGHTAWLLFHHGLVVALQSHHPFGEVVLALIDDAKVALPEDALHLIVLLEFGEDAQAGELRIEAHEEVLVARVELSQAPTVAQPQGEHLWV